MFKKILLSSITLVLSGCGSTSVPVNVAQQIYSNSQFKVPLPRAQIMPSLESLAGEQLKAIVLNTQEQDELGNKFLAGKAMASLLDDLLHRAGIDVIDRSIGGKLRNEILAYEASGIYDESALTLANVAILPLITSASFSSDYTEGHYSKTFLIGKKVWIDPTCTFNAKVSGVAKRYELPSLNVSHQVVFSGANEMKRDANNVTCSLSPSEKQGLFTETAKQVIRNHEKDIQNKFSPKGYVTEYKVLNNRHYIKINIGENRKLKKGTYINFIKQIKTMDDLTGESNIAQIKSGAGKLTSFIQENSSWVLVKARVAASLSLGDIAQVEFKKSSWDYINDLSQAAKTL